MKKIVGSTSIPWVRAKSVYFEHLGVHFEHFYMINYWFKAKKTYKNKKKKGKKMGEKCSFWTPFESLFPTYLIEDTQPSI